MAKIFCTGQITAEQLPFVKEQINKQTIQPAWAVFYIDPKPAKGVDNRRKRIAQNHNKLIDLVKKQDCDYVLQIEGDGLLPENTIQKLLSRLIMAGDTVGYISGVELGRHGVECIGAWHFNKDRTEFKSLDYRAIGLQEVDATGFYCLLAKKDVWLKGKASWNGERWGPDVNYGLSLREQGYRIYCDTSLKIGHRWVNKFGEHILGFDSRNICNASFTYKSSENRWIFKQIG